MRSGDGGDDSESETGSFVSFAHAGPLAVQWLGQLRDVALWDRIAVVRDGDDGAVAVAEPVTSTVEPEPRIGRRCR